LHIQTSGSNIAACGNDARAIVFSDHTNDTPHEVGHALGRKHAPCLPSGRCNPSPANVDDHYPQYGAFQSDSIGVFGFDATTNTVFNPANTFDFMSYSCTSATPGIGPCSQWVSAYTYMALAGAFPSVVPSSSGGLGSAHATGAVEIETLFLQLKVFRERRVLRRPSFHFPALPRSLKPCQEFTVDLLDAERCPIVCAGVACDCDTGCHCWPRTLSGEIPYPPNARWLQLFENDRLIYEEYIPAPPEVKVIGADRTEAGVVLTWTARKPPVPECHPGCCDLWYLVLWRDQEGDCWRGVAPRTQDTSLLIPARLFHRAENLTVRVLATCGISTGFADHEIGYKRPPGHDNPPPQVVVVGLANGVLDNVIGIAGVDASGRSVDTVGDTWHDTRGGELGRGTQFDLRTLGQGSHTLRAVIRLADGSYLGKTLIVERRGDAFHLTYEADDPPPRPSADRPAPDHQHGPGYPDHKH
jgi:hypothetical protein